MSLIFEIRLAGRLNHIHLTVIIVTKMPGNKSLYIPGHHWIVCISMLVPWKKHISITNSAVCNLYGNIIVLKRPEQFKSTQPSLFNNKLSKNNLASLATCKPKNHEFNTFG